jgi:DNA-binding response OmpR family regulator
MDDDLVCLQQGLKNVEGLDPLLCDSKIAHEYALFQFNNLATAIVGHAQLALNNPTYDSLKRSARISSEFGQKVADLARSLLVFSGGSTGETAYHDLNDLLRQVVAVLEPIFERSGMKVRAEYGTLPPLEVDGVAIREILFNLLNHRVAPVEGAEAPPEIVIRTDSAESLVRVALEYRNTYVPRETLDQYCVPLFNLSTVRPGPTEEAAASLTSSIGGRNGVTADVTYPDSATTVLTIGIPLHQGQARTRSARVLVVDDEPVILSIFSRFITKAGHKVETASGGTEALEKIRKNHYDVVLLDWMMPGISGAEVLHQAAPAHPRLPFVVVTAAYSSKVAAQAVDAGALECIGKPLNHKKVLYLINKYCGGVQSIEQSPTASIEGQGEVLLVAEPEPLTRDLYHLMFDNAGYETSIVATYEECVHSLEKEYFDAILMNDSLLRRDASERLRGMRRLNPYTPVLVIGEIEPHSSQQQSVMSGAAAYLEKPLEIRKFLLKLRAILDLYKEPSASRYKV